MGVGWARPPSWGLLKIRDERLKPLVGVGQRAWFPALSTGPQRPPKFHSFTHSLKRRLAKLEPAPSETCCVEAVVDAAELLNGAGDHAVDLLLVGDINGKRLDLDIGVGLDKLRAELLEGGLVHVDHDNLADTLVKESPDRSTGDVLE